MAEEALASQEIPVAKLAEGAESNGIPVKVKFAISWNDHGS